MSVRSAPITPATIPDTAMAAAMTPNTSAWREVTTRANRACGVRSWNRVMFGMTNAMFATPTRKNRPMASTGSLTAPVTTNSRPIPMKPPMAPPSVP